MNLHEALLKHPDFARLDAKDLAVLEKAFTVEAWDGTGEDGGHAFLTQGDRGEAAWLLLDGEVTVTREREPFMDELRRLHPGEMFGLASLVDDMRRSASCRALGPVRVARIERSAFDWLLRDHAALGLAMQRAVARQLASDYRAATKRVHALLAERRR